MSAPFRAASEWSNRFSLRRTMTGKFLSEYGRTDSLISIRTVAGLSGSGSSSFGLPLPTFFGSDPTPSAVSSLSGLPSSVTSGSGFGFLTFSVPLKYSSQHQPPTAIKHAASASTKTGVLGFVRLVAAGAIDSPRSGAACCDEPTGGLPRRGLPSLSKRALGRGPLR